MVGGYIFVDSDFRNELLNETGTNWYFGELIETGDNIENNKKTFKYLLDLYNTGKVIYLINQYVSNRILSPVLVTLYADYNSKNEIEMFYVYTSIDTAYTGIAGWTVRKDGHGEEIVLP